VCLSTVLFYVLVRSVWGISFISFLEEFFFSSSFDWNVTKKKGRGEFPERHTQTQRKTRTGTG
jgi:hypothetical protein